MCCYDRPGEENMKKRVFALGSSTLKVFSEQYNGYNKTDYASDFVNIPLTVVDDATVPTLTAGEQVNCTTDTAEVTFTSDEAGTYYYAVMEEGVTSPIVDTTGAGTACDTIQQTINITGLMAEAKDIYIIVKDAAGNVSETLACVHHSGICCVYAYGGSYTYTSN